MKQITRNGWSGSEPGLEEEPVYPPCAAAMRCASTAAHRQTLSGTPRSPRACPWGGGVGTSQEGGSRATQPCAGTQVRRLHARTRDAGMGRYHSQVGSAGRKQGFPPAVAVSLFRVPAASTPVTCIGVLLRTFFTNSARPSRLRRGWPSPSRPPPFHRCAFVAATAWLHCFDQKAVMNTSFDDTIRDVLYQ